MSVMTYKDKEVLNDLYWKKKLSTVQIGEKFGVTSGTIHSWMEKLGIPTRNLSEAVKNAFKQGRLKPFCSEEHKKAVSDGLKKAYKSGRRVAWNKGNQTSEESRRRISEGLKQAYLMGRRDAQETGRKISVALKGRVKVQLPKEELEKLYWKEGLPAHKIAKKFGVSRQTIINYMRKSGTRVRTRSESSKRFIWNRGLTKETDERIRKIAEKKRGKPRPDIKELCRDPDFIKRKLRGLIKRPTKPEQVLISIIKKHNLPFHYTGNGEVFVGTKCPDFSSNNGDNRLLEVFGRAFHDPEVSFRAEIPWHQQYWGRLAYYAGLGYNCLILWDDELGNEERVINKIQRFMVG